MEDRQKICDLLLPALQETSNLQDLENLTYNENNETVIATFWYGRKKIVNVHLDSWTAMINDIVRQIV